MTEPYEQIIDETDDTDDRGRPVTRTEYARLSRRVEAAERLVRKTRLTAQEAIETRRTVFRDVFDAGLKISDITEITGLADRAVRIQVWPPDGVNGRYPKRSR